jgi:hypothetical protein
LIILGGGQLGRRWRNPVPLLQLVCSAIGEAEMYFRVNTGQFPQVAMHGAAVADLIHLLAELVDNATTFSPPSAQVEVRGQLVGRGVVLEIEDHGLGMEPAQLEEMNEMLHNPPDFGVMALSDEPRLGLFVVARLAVRHGVQVTLTTAPSYGGTRAVVLLPSTLIAAAVTGPIQPEAQTGRRPGLVSGGSGVGAGRSPGPALGPGRRAGLGPGLGSGPVTGPPSGPIPGPVPGTGPIPGPVPTSGPIPGPAPGTGPIPRTAPGPVANPNPAPDPGPAPGPRRPAPAPVPSRPVMPRADFIPTRNVKREDPTHTQAQGAAKPPPDNGDRPPLPRRIRQANLAPQLVGETRAQGEPDLPATSLPTAERARDRLAALQRETRRAREGASDVNGDPAK